MAIQKKDKNKKKILFVCSANKQRSKTGEDYFSSIYDNYIFQSAGTNLKVCEKEGTNPITEDQVIWSDLIFVMEHKHKTIINKHTGDKYDNKIIQLDIPDIYKYYQQELISILEKKVTPILNNSQRITMTFEAIKSKYSDREQAFPIHCPEPNEADLNELIEKYNCKFPKSFIDFQLKYCKEVPMGDFAFEGFGWANKKSSPNMSLEEILNGYAELEFPKYLTPFRYDNGDYWCFDNRSSEDEFPVVIFDHNSYGIETDPNYNWENFMDWLDKTMEDEY